MLELVDVHAGYGASRVLQGVSLRVGAGEVVGLLGRNGAGKSTTLKSILGLTHIKSGSVYFENQEISRWPAHRIPRLGIGYVPQGRRVFPKLTVKENLLIGGARTPIDRSRLDRVLDAFPQLRDRLKQRAGTLSGGEQQMLAIVRALLMDSQLILLDEPTEGLMPSLVAAVEQRISQMKEEGRSVLIAEQRLQTAMNICDRAYVLEKGRVVWQGEIKESRRAELASHLGVKLE